MLTYKQKTTLDKLLKRRPLLSQTSDCVHCLSTATWFIKVTYLNQLQTRQTPNSISVAGSDNQRSQWTKDVVEYLQHMLDEFCSKEGAFVHPSFREQSSPGPTAGTNQIKMKTEASPAKNCLFPQYLSNDYLTNSRLQSRHPLFL
uniref:Uncharacterized protein n=1 Tax=Zea mays TaxID=4577 RepID=A0A804Q3V2_MAIZE